MGLRSKLVVGISMYLGLLAFVGLMGLYDAQVSLNGLHDALEHHVRELSLLANLSSAVGRVHSVVLVHVLTNAVTSGPAERAAYEAQTGELEREIDLLVEQQVDLQRTFGDQVDIDRFGGASILRGSPRSLGCSGQTDPISSRPLSSGSRPKRRTVWMRCATRPGAAMRSR